MRNIKSLAELLVPRRPGLDPLEIERRTIAPLGKKLVRRTVGEAGERKPAEPPSRKLA